MRLALHLNTSQSTMRQTNSTWNPDSICLNARLLDAKAIAPSVYERVCRTDFDQPGFCSINLGESIPSVGLRQFMTQLKQEMTAIETDKTGKTLVYLSASRFDQQVSTKPHLDGGPEECFLLLGYEPSEILCEIEIADYSKCAFQLSMTPQEFMGKYNPMFKSGSDMLRSFTTRIPCFDPTCSQILCINNSSSPHSPLGDHWQGTLHTATILNPDDSKRRIINSMMIARATQGTIDTINESDIDHFIHTAEVKRRGYDKPHLSDE